MKHTFKAIVTQIESATTGIVDGGFLQAPTIKLILVGISDETPKSINEKLQDLVGGTHGDGRVTITIEREDEMKYSKPFERDWKFYTRNLDTFNFAGKPVPEVARAFGDGPGAKECFYIHDSTGDLQPCSKPELLQRVLICKASVNLHIKLWAYGVAHNVLPLDELYEYLSGLKAPQWVADAVVAQAGRLVGTSVTIGESAKCL